MAEFNDESTKLVQSSVSTNLDLSDKLLNNNNGEVTAENSVDRIKSAISVVQEIAQKRDLSIRFVVESETGPAHMKHFIIKCSVGEIEVCISSAYNYECNLFIIVIFNNNNNHILTLLIFLFSCESYLTVDYR